LEVSHSLNNLALIHHTEGQNDKAMKYHRKALAYKESSVDVGKDHPDTLVSVNNLGVVLHSQGRYARAEELFGRALTGWSQAFGADDLFVLTAQSNMAIAAAAQDRLTEAEALHRQVLAKRQRLLGSFHHDTSVKYSSAFRMTAISALHIQIHSEHTQI
jgi:Tfp pilus assembly protein PilF